MAQRIQVRRGTAEQWATVNPTLASGEPGYETDTGKHKLGDGVTAWNGLPYFVDTVGLNAAYGKRSVSTAPTQKLPPRHRPTWVSTFAPGHGWTNPFSFGTIADDTADYIIGTQSLVVTDTAAQKGSLALDLTGKMLALWMKLDSVGATDDIVVYAADATFANYYNWTITAGEDASPWFRTGEWVLVTLPFENAAVVGAPNRASLATLRVRALSTATFHINAIGTVAESTTWPNGLVSITFDDGYDDTLLAAQQSMTPKGLTGTLFTIPEAIGAVDFLTEAQLADLQNVHGWDIQAHGLDTYTLMTEDELRAEWSATKEWFAARGLGRPDHLAYVGGQNDDTVVKVAREFFTTARTVSGRTLETWPPAGPHRLRAMSSISSASGGNSVATVQAAIDRAKAGGNWLILVFHRIVDTPSSTVECSWTDFNAILDYVNSSGVDVRTVTDAMPSGSVDEIAAAMGGVRTFISGRYYGPPGAAPGTLTLPVGRCTITPFWVPQATTIDRLAAEVTTGGASSVARIGIYDSTPDDRPGSLVLDAGTVAADTAGVKEATVSQPLRAGLYWLALAVQGSSSVTLRTVGNDNLPPVASTAPMTTAARNCYYGDSVTGALPASASGINIPASGGIRVEVRAV
jgi:peptidoglycan/xylan/chitin deacetylase (PgdA/CDA1 family)